MLQVLYRLNLSVILKGEKCSLAYDSIVSLFGGELVAYSLLLFNPQIFLACMGF